MRLLLDTHAFLWFVADDRRLSATSLQAICDPRNVVHFSTASAWEIAIKTNIGKLQLAVPYGEMLPGELDRNGMASLHIAWPHLWRYHRLPLYHRDPFDRMLVAQALADDLTLVSKDTMLDRYGVERLW